VTDVEVVVSAAAEQAIEAFDQSTFSVGGVLLDARETSSTPSTTTWS
jgi:hypothetical protein